jgi:hypothetical protein
MADKAAEVMAEGANAFQSYKQRQLVEAAEEATFVAGFMAGYLMGYSQGLDEDLFERVVGKMQQRGVKAIVVPYKARNFSLKLDPA